MMDFYFMLSYSPDLLSLYLFPYCYRGRKPSSKHISKQCLPLTLLRERSGSVVECLTRDRRAAGSSLTGVTVLCP